MSIRMASTGLWPHSHTSGPASQRLNSRAPHERSAIPSAGRTAVSLTSLTSQCGTSGAQPGCLDSAELLKPQAWADALEQTCAAAAQDRDDVQLYLIDKPSVEVLVDHIGTTSDDYILCRWPPASPARVPASGPRLIPTAAGTSALQQLRRRRGVASTPTTGARRQQHAHIDRAAEGRGQKSAAAGLAE